MQQTSGTIGNRWIAYFVFFRVEKLTYLASAVHKLCQIIELLFRVKHLKFQ